MARYLALVALIALLATIPAPYTSQAAGGTPSFILLRSSADLRFAASIPNKAERASAVYAALREHAEREQGPILALLESRGIEARGFVTVNAISAELDPATAAVLGSRRDVAQVIADKPWKVQEPPKIEDEPVEPQGADAVEWGISNIKADQVWSSYGITGTGVVVAGSDTGIMWEHAALKDQYRGWNGASADHSYSWHDAIHEDIDGSNDNPCGFNTSAPCDDNGHGTHTLGTMVGDDGAGNQIGVAPGARWIGCRNMEDGYGRIATYVECFDWFLAPTDSSGNNPRPDLAPDIINNSWGCVPPPHEDCSSDQLSAIEPSVQSLTAAGILVVASAGNSGSSCETIDNPPALYPDSLTVGAYNIDNQIASFSSRGPIVYNGNSRVGPDLTAPGVQVRSSYIGPNYAEMQGTSMAAPHVAGAAALLWSARPDLIGDIDFTRQVLQETATPTSAPSTACDANPSARPNNVYGWGRLNALAAVERVLLVPQLWLPLVSAP